MVGLLVIVALGLAIAYALSKCIRWVFHPAIKPRPVETKDTADVLSTQGNSR